MSALSIQLIIESARKLISQNISLDLTWLAIGLIGGALVTKFCLFLFCWSMRQHPVVGVLAKDHRNDMVLNSFGIALSIMGEKVHWTIDPIGGLIIALLILKSWSSTAYGTFIIWMDRQGI